MAPGWMSEKVETSGTMQNTTAPFVPCTVKACIAAGKTHHPPLGSPKCTTLMPSFPLFSSNLLLIVGRKKELKIYKHKKVYSTTPVHPRIYIYIYIYMWIHEKGLKRREPTFESQLRS